MSDNEMSRHDHILANLVFSLQAAAMQQLGKIQNPVSGEIEIDLVQAKSTIDVLEMLKVKCRTDTPETLLRLVDQTVMDLQLNYMDEVKKSAKQDESDEAQTAADEPADAPADTTDGGETTDTEAATGDEATE